MKIEMPDRSKSNRLRIAGLKLASLVLGYRFHNFLDPLRLPYQQTELDAKEVREKSRASSAVVGVFLGLLAAGLAALLSLEVPSKIELRDWRLSLMGIAALPYLILWEQRKVSAAKWEAKHRQMLDGKENKEKYLRTWCYTRLAFWALLYIALFRIMTSSSRADTSKQVLGLAGLLFLLLALVLLVIAIELYDTAGGWQKLTNTAFHFHLASLASHCYILGIAMTFVGFSLLLCLWHLRAGYLLSVGFLLVFSLVSEFERALFHAPTLTQEDVQKRALAIYIEEGRSGAALDHWLKAERELTDKLTRKESKE